MAAYGLKQHCYTKISSAFLYNNNYCVIQHFSLCAYTNDYSLLRVSYHFVALFSYHFVGEE